MPSRPVEKYDDDDFGFGPNDQFKAPSVSTSSASSSRPRKPSDDHLHAHPTPSSRRTMASPPGTVKSGPGKGSFRLKTLNDLARLKEDETDEFASGYEIAEGSISSRIKLPVGRVQSNMSTSSRSTIRNFQMDVSGSGMGTITRYTSRRPEGAGKGKKVEEKESWDDDFGGDGFGPGAKLSLSTQLKAKQANMAKRGADESISMDGFDDDDEATLKASNTIKARLPPPAAKPNTIRSLRDNPVIAPPKHEVEDMEEGLIIPAQGLRLVPLNKHNLAAMNKQHAANGPPLKKIRKPADECDSPATSSSISRAGKSSAWSDGNNSPKGFSFSETSATSFTSISTPKDAPCSDASRRVINDDDDDLDGLVFPSKAFTSGQAIRRLEKRKAANYASYVDRVRGDGDRKGKGFFDETDDASEEHGLVFSNARLSERELDRLARKREREAEQQRQQKANAGGLRAPPASTPSQARTPSPIGQMTPGGTFRSQSTSIPTPNAKITSARPRTSLDNQPSAHTPATPRSLRRHQSTADFAMSSGSALRSKASMPNIEESAARSPPSPSAHRSYNSTTGFRVMNPTASSSAKAKSKVRPPLPTSFGSRHGRDDHVEASSVSSISTAASARPDAKEYKYGSSGRSTGKGSSGRRAGTGGHKSVHTIEWTVPKVQRPMTDPTALDDIPDLDADDAASPKNSLEVKSRVTEPTISSKARAVKLFEEGDGHAKRGKKKGPQLIKWNGVPVKKQIGNSTFDPRTMRWIAPDDEATMAYFNRFEPSVPAGPALIVEKPTPRASGDSVGGGSTVKIVGDMRFDPEKMCWVALGEEKAVDWGDEWDEDEDGRGGTIRARKLVTVGTASMGRSTSTTDTNISTTSRVSLGSSRFASVSNVSVITEEGVEGEHGGGQQRLVSEELRKECMRAERRHRRELQRWFGSRKGSEDGERREQREWERLMLIREEAS